MSLLNHGEELNAKAPPWIYLFMYRQLKLIPMVFVLAKHNINLKHHVNMQFDKLPTTSYATQCNKRWGHDFTRNREGKYSNY